MRPRWFGCVAWLTVALSGCGSLPSRHSSSPGNVVRIAGTKGHWQILLNGRPFELQGVGAAYARGSDGADYLAMARAMGANTVRTWGTRQGTREFLDQAHRYGLYVDAGIWLNPVYEDGTCSYITDTAYQRQVRDETIQYVTAYKNHPAILFWNIGNETIHFTRKEEERVAFSRFLEALVQEVHAIDPHHPVIHTSAFTSAVDYVKRYAPSVDIFGLNVYGGLEDAHREVIDKLSIPYVVTEFGPIGPWDRPRDIHGKAIELTDVERSEFYEQQAAFIQRHRGYALGGFPFALGEANQVSLIWWNLNYQRYKRFAFLKLQALYTKQPMGNRPPAVRALEFSKQQALRPGEPFEIRVDYWEPEGEAVEFRYFASTSEETPTLEEFQNREIPLKVDGRGPVVKAEAPRQEGIYRIYVVAVDPHDLAGTLSGTISVTAP
ncbi:MAG: hypothetical protein HY737_08785 [Candidatus Omnitrophica bacterium]|nr:hypothetical protein [Candidatus Omnitrophota bacterium]